MTKEDGKDSVRAKEMRQFFPTFPPQVFDIPESGLRAKN
jgi:hypothetical protein